MVSRVVFFLGGFRRHKWKETGLVTHISGFNKLNLVGPLPTKAEVI